MKLLIEIPEERYEEYKRIGDSRDILFEAIRKGKPLDESFEWCHDCKEYDNEKHCCSRWTKVIRTTLNDSINAVLDEIRAEIENIEYLSCPQPDVVLNDVLQIIDKYKDNPESEE